MRMHLGFVLAVAALTACGSSSPAVLEFVEIIPVRPKIGDVVTVRFRLIDARGVPMAGTKVDFKLQSNNLGVALDPPSATSIRGTGFAETQVVANARVNSVIVVATAGEKEVASPPITFAGTVPHGRQLTFQCGPVAGAGSGGRHAIGAFDQSRHLIAGSALECTAHVGDRNGDGVVGALVSFLTEAGTVGPSETSVADLVGNATVLYKTSLPLPLEVEPGTFTWSPRGATNLPTDRAFTGEYLAPLWMHPFEWVQNPLSLAGEANPNYTLEEPRRADPIRWRVDGSARNLNNPRDNLVTLIAVTSGEEGFTDSNNNGQYDSGEIFDDLTEPFVDSNDNGTWDSFERFIDVDGSGEWNGKNGQWDANTLVWRQERILWTGIPADEDMRKSIPGIPEHLPIFNPVTPNDLAFRCPPTSTCTQAGNPDDGYKPYTVVSYIADPWFNAMAQNGEQDTCGITLPKDSPVKATSATGQGFAFTYPAGRLLTFYVSDARDPLAKAEDQIPRRDPPIGFRSAISCTYTSSPKDGYKTNMSAGTIEGTIE